MAIYLSMDDYRAHRPVSESVIDFAKRHFYYQPQTAPIAS
jgi:hypothetical protein